MKMTKEDIHQATRNLLLIGGYDYLTFAKLSQELGVTRPALYKHYPTKDELILAMMSAEMTSFLEDMPALIASKPTDILTVLLNKFLEFADIHRLLESLYRIDYETRQKFPDRMLALKQAHEMFKDYLDQLIDQAKAQNVFNNELPNEWIVKFLMNAIHMIEDRQNIEEIDIVKKLLLHGLAKHEDE
ncbi:TetR/AcrR family transcriptional regulator [Vagococcus zengguangii]|uniref:TetR/AcrR family transcriptional regulator n=1 Tax=Vagococcus zengguangii TaxID=2571750 RepID=A0A4D7CSF6_9ENTE|nr:TetR/AcrR family transcriptional regulator [Vagococcus zengguangii]QCI85824.1 TetR/AcrR family transcriptional regulator [Vagococcus zengguangii]TLG81765.1 TetR/AcrR family transcriptional regulator [Vagococcus zengguangii]